MLSGWPVIYGGRLEHFSFAEDGAEAGIFMVKPSGWKTQELTKLGGEESFAELRERHRSKSGDKVQLISDLKLVRLFDQAIGQRFIA